MSNLPAQSFPSANGAVWKVTDASQTTDQDSTGRYTKGWAVTYQVPSGHTGTVFVAGTTLNPDMVKAAIDQAAANLTMVVGMSSGG